MEVCHHGRIRCSECAYVDELKERERETNMLLEDHVRLEIEQAKEIKTLKKQLVQSGNKIRKQNIRLEKLNKEKHQYQLYEKMLLLRLKKSEGARYGGERYTATD